eukprot:m51a1_g150 hypothetical protein (501) ;mRNA; r:475006-477361
MASTNDGSGLFAGERIFLSKVSRAAADAVRDGITKRGGFISDDADSATAIVTDSFQDEFCVQKPRSARVYGTKCLMDSIVMNKPLPTRPVFSRVMENVSLSVTSDLADIAAQLKLNVELMNGTFLGESLSSCATHLCTRSVLSPSYQVAVQRGLPVVRPNWVQACWQAQTLLPISREYALPVFAGCTICVTGLSFTTRQHVEKMTTMLGGVFTPEFSKRCTHLIAQVPNGPKFRASQSWRIPAVSFDWFIDCINSNTCLPFGQYLMHEPLYDSSGVFALDHANGGAPPPAPAVAAATPVKQGGRCATGVLQDNLRCSLSVRGITRHLHHNRRSIDLAPSVLSHKPRAVDVARVAGSVPWLRGMRPITLMAEPRLRSSLPVATQEAAFSVLSQAQRSTPLALGSEQLPSDSAATPGRLHTALSQLLHACEEVLQAATVLSGAQQAQQGQQQAEQQAQTQSAGQSASQAPPGGGAPSASSVGGADGGTVDAPMSPSCTDASP